MNRILLVDLGERELNKRNELRARIAAVSGVGRKLNAGVRYVLLDFGGSLGASPGTRGSAGKKRPAREG